MKIDELTQEQKEIFCMNMAEHGYYEEIDSAYCNALDFFDIEEPNDKGFSYHEGIGGELYQEVVEAMNKVLYLRLMFMATYDSGNFPGLTCENKGYEFAISMLDKGNDFDDIIDSMDI